MFLSLLPDTHSFEKTKEWSEVRNIMTLLGEDITVVKIPGTKLFAGELGLICGNKLLVNPGNSEAEACIDFFRLNKIDAVKCATEFNPNNYVYDWSTNTLWSSEQNNSVVDFFKNLVEIKFIPLKEHIELRKVFSIGLKLDCLINTRYFDNDLTKCLDKSYFLIDINEDCLDNVVQTYDGICYENLQAESIHKIDKRYKNLHQVNIKFSNAKLKDIIIPIMG